MDTKSSKYDMETRTREVYTTRETTGGHIIKGSDIVSIQRLRELYERQGELQEIVVSI